MNALKDNNSFLMERLSQIKEIHIKKMRESFTVPQGRRKASTKEN